LEVLIEFERKLGTPLPDAYREYLLAFNGGKFEKDVISISEAEGETTVHHMFGLHSGPRYAQLRNKRTISGSLFLAICDDSFGNQFLIKLTGGQAGTIHFLDHEVEPEEGLTGVASDFNEFVAKMKSEEEFMHEFAERDPEGYRWFMERLEQAKRDHQAFVDAQKEQPPKQ
jgi:hypothetical protein